MIKKVVGIFALLFCMHAAGYAQLKFGLKAGLNISRVHHKSRFDKKVYGFMPSAHVGLYANKNFSEDFFLSGEFLLSDKGFEKDGATHLLYASMPAMANFRIVDKLFLGVGPEWGILIAPIGEDTEFVKEVYSNRLDIGGAVGLQYAVGSAVIISVRWVRGFSNIIGRNAEVGYYPFSKQSGALLSGKLREIEFVQKNECLQFSIGYSL